MTEVRFYHMTRTPLDQSLPQMMEKTLERGQRAVVRAGSAARVEDMSASLWTHHYSTFLPHQTLTGGRADTLPVFMLSAASAHTTDESGILHLELHTGTREDSTT